MITLFILKVLVLLNHVVDIVEVAVVVAIVGDLLLVVDVGAHSTVPGLCNYLGLHHLALLGELGGLLNGIS
jgi:hypothetical protein